MSKMAAALALDADAGVAASSLPRRNVCYTFLLLLLSRLMRAQGWANMANGIIKMMT